MTRLSSFGGKILSGYLVSLLLLLISYFLIFYVQQRLVKAAARVVESYDVINHIESVKSECINAETGLRGYALTKDIRFLEPYNTAVERMPALFTGLRGSMIDDSDQQSRLDTFTHLVSKRMDSMASGLARFRANNLVIVHDSQQREQSLLTMDSMRLYAERIKEEEIHQMQHGQNRLSSLFSGSRILVTISLGIVFAALLYSFIIFTLENKARRKADKRADNYMMDLESNKSELQEKNNELKELRDMEKFTSTGRIARTIAHEVRNPLTNILLATEQLQEMQSKNEDSLELLQLINRNATRINQLVSELLDATRFVNLNFEKVELTQLLEETLEMAKDRIELNRVSVEKTYYPETCEVSVDKEKIKVAFLNIIVNAIEAMDNGTGLLQIKTKKLGDKCIVEVRDNGKGMDEEVLQKLFEPYYTNKPKGNGLGLTNTQNIILNHNGKIGVYSKPGEGSLFTIMLDMAKG